MKTNIKLPEAIFGVRTRIDTIVEWLRVRELRGGSYAMHTTETTEFHTYVLLSYLTNMVRNWRGDDSPKPKARVQGIDPLDPRRHGGQSCHDPSNDLRGAPRVGDPDTAFKRGG